MRTNIEYTPVLKENISLLVMLNTLPTKGNLVYEYNPFRNYRLNSNKYWYKENYYTKEELEDNYGIVQGYIENEMFKPSENSETPPTTWGYLKDDKYEVLQGNTPELYEKGLLVDFVTDELKFSLNNPVHIVPLYSYDGSVNLIINDGVNIPRLINSRFSATGKNTYEIIDRKGSNDTNIYDEGELFDIDTSLYKIVNKIPKVNFLGTSSGGNLKIGNYHFYFKLTDTDGNETDFVAESGLVSVFIGFNSYGSVHTGNKNENSTKLVEFRLENVDSAYDYINVYYSRYTAENGENSVYEYKKILKKYSRTSPRITITGFEDTLDIAVTDLNLHYNLVESAKTSTVCLNMLFMGNVKLQSLPYEELQDLSLRILPFLGTEPYDPGLNPYYHCDNPLNSYVDSKFIYNKTGYWAEELYRFGVVYILPNGALTPVFNVRGALDIGASGKGFSKIDVRSDEERKYIKYNETNSYIIDDSKALYRINEGRIETVKNFTNYYNENVKGVCRFIPPVNDSLNPDIYYVKFAIPKDLQDELKKYVKGYFFVRQTRIPTILALGITIGIDKESRTPTIPTAGGILTLLNLLEKTHVETENINGINYISEGFLKRYSFSFKKKSSSLWGKIGAIVGTTILVAAAVVASVYGSPAAGLAIVNIAGPIVGLGATAATMTAVATAVVVGGAAVVAAGTTALVATAQEIGQAVMRIGEHKKLNGRATKTPDGYKLVETDDSRQLTNNFNDRIIIKDTTKNLVQGILCPDYTINLPFYNLVFIGNEHLIRTDVRQSYFKDSFSGESYFTNSDRHFYIDNYKNISSKLLTTCKIIGVSDGVTSVGLGDLTFRARAGLAEEAWRFLQVGTEREDSDKKINSDIIRGNFGPYLAFDNSVIGPAKIVNIYTPGYEDSKLLTYVESRMLDNSTYYAITDRFSIDEGESTLMGDLGYTGHICNAYRGDCYICLFTHRINRNFNDPSAPYNDDIVDPKIWKDKYDPNKTDKFAEINLGDVNAVLLGMWVTFLLRSNNNLNIRTLDTSNVAEDAMTGHARGYYPILPMSVEGIYKKPESHLYNKGFNKSVSEKWNFGMSDVPHIKNWFGTRIMYSDIHINDGFKNGFRVFQGTNYRDYTREYGEIVKLISLESNLLCVFEHGIALIPVNERAVAGLGAGGNVYINTSNVLPENPKIISDMFGSLWPESILKVPGKNGNSAQYVYGVDTIAKKIWRTDGNSLECISDFRVQEFLNNNITLGERENTPIIGIRNVKTHYNAYKLDVLFTFYDNTYGFEEKAWNLCWNELLLKFITFYSWVPSYMENINNIPFSFDRTTSKWLAKLGTSHTESSFADGITLSNVIVDHDNYDLNFEKVTDVLIDGKEDTFVKAEGKIDLDKIKHNYIGELSLSNRMVPSTEYSVNFELVRDLYKNNDKFIIKTLVFEDNSKKQCLYLNTNKEDYQNVYILEGDSFDKIYMEGLQEVFTYYPTNGIKSLCSELYYRNSAGNSYADDDINKKAIINYDDSEIFNNRAIFKDLSGKRPMLPKDKLINPDKLVTLLNIKATILIVSNSDVTLSDTFYNSKASFDPNTTLIDAGYYESVVAVIPKWNMQFLSTDFWKHGLAGIIDIADEIFPTNWYGKQHPFEFECIVINDPATHKIFLNLELVANKAKPESFHYEIVGECYDFAKDKVNMYFRLEAKKALWLYNGADITYNRNFLKMLPKCLKKSADLPTKYYNRIDTINEIEDYYKSATMSADGHTYNHLSGAEIVYYPNRLEYRIWQHTPAISLDDLSLDDAKSIISANCKYLEDRWRVTINPILICYKNEKWDKNPPLTIRNSPIPDSALAYIKENDDNVDIPKELADRGYSNLDIDFSNWLNDINIYKTNFGEALNRKEIDLKDRFIKIRIRYSGDELAVINFLNTIYQNSYT